jgi:hypothetical protein
MALTWPRGLLGLDQRLASLTLYSEQRRVYQLSLATQAQTGGGRIIAIQRRGGKRTGKNRAQCFFASLWMGWATGLLCCHHISA